MAILHITYDLDRQRFTGASANGRCFTDARVIHITGDSCQVLDKDGVDLLAPESAAASRVKATEETAKVEADIAAYFSRGAEEDEGNGRGRA